MVKFYTHFNLELIDLYDDIFTSMGYADGIVHFYAKNINKLKSLKVAKLRKDERRMMKNNEG